MWTLIAKLVQWWRLISTITLSMYLSDSSYITLRCDSDAASIYENLKPTSFDAVGKLRHHLLNDRQLEARVLTYDFCLQAANAEECTQGRSQ